MNTSNRNHLALLKELTAIGIALSAEKENAHLLEMILIKAKEFTNADGATMYECTEDGHLQFKILINSTKKIHCGGTSGIEIKYQPLPLYDKDGIKNTHMVATWVAINKKTVNIKDAYHEKKFDFSGTFIRDKQIGYHSKSFLTVPMTNHLNEVIGVLQLINAQDRESNEIIAFSQSDQEIIESLASQAAVSLTNRNLIQSQKELFDSFIQLIANAIDEKSHYTGQDVTPFSYHLINP